ncbi:MAG TPA: clostripain-related cysteine peptidase, partial [Spirochaetota bacterium]|nr:clostripain-related cysteine peptidase [Spirochaetota bacterium]
MKFLFLMVVLTVFLFISCEIEKKKPEDKDKIDTTRTLPKDKSEWTFIYYYNADNNLESFMVEDINEVKKNIKNDNKISVVVLIDRIQGYSDDSGVFGEDFTDTRLYEIIPNGVIRLN